MRPDGTDHVRWRQQATDLAAIVGRLMGAGWDHPIFALVERRARQASSAGDLLSSSVLDELDAAEAFRSRTRPPDPLPPQAAAASGLSRAERRRLEREARRRGGP